MQQRECGWSQARSGVFTGWRCRRGRHWLRAVANGLRGAGPCQEIAVNHFFTEIGRRCDNIRSYDDIASGIAGIAFCICCTAIFSAVFVGSI
jgi:hypothetical protein